MTLKTSFRRAVLAALPLLLANCANGDFGEIRPGLLGDDVHNWVAADTTGSLSSLNLTDDERQLRDLAYPLIEPPYHRHQWYSFAVERGALPGDFHEGADKTAYARMLLALPNRSPIALYAQLTDDIRNDTTRLPQFFETGARVLDIDAKRRQALVFIEQSGAEKGETERRINENFAIVARVQKSLAGRIASYQFALERLVSTTPASQAVDVEQSLNRLKAVLAGYRFGAPTGRSRDIGLARD